MENVTWVLLWVLSGPTALRWAPISGLGVMM